VNERLRRGHSSPAKCHFALLLASAFCVLHANVAPAAEPAVASPFIVDVWGTSGRQAQKKLPQSSVVAITQTRDGYLWLGTLKGLVRFDGDRFTVYDENNTPGLPNSRIVHLFEDSRGWLWVGTEAGGVALVRDGQVSSLPVGRGSSAGKLMSACEDADGAVWLYTADGQLWRYAGGLLTRVIESGFPSACRSVITERGGQVWLGTDMGEFRILKAEAAAGTGFTGVQEAPAGKLDFLLASARGGYWRLADNRIEKWSGRQRERSLGFYPWADVPNTRVSCACEDLDGNLVVGTLSAGVYWFDASGKATHIGAEDGLSFAGVLSVCVDREGNLWVGTDGGGLNRIKRRVGEVLPGSQGKVVQSACEDATGAIWVGCNWNGLARWHQGEVTEFDAAQGMLSRNVWSVFTDSSGQVWAGTRSPGGLFQFRDGRFQLMAVAGSLGREVLAMYQDRGGRLWLGTPNGLAAWDGKAWKTFTTLDGLSAEAVRAIVEDAAGNLWVGTEGGGIDRLRDGQFSVFRKVDGLPGDNVSSLLVDGDGVLWVGTSSGLGRFKDGKWVRFTTREGLTSNSINYLMEDGAGCLWIGSNAGLMRVWKRELNDVATGALGAVTCRAYDEADGLPTSECTEGSQPAALRTRGGKLWFPTINGLVGIMPAELKRNTNPPPVLVESVLAEGRELLTNGLRGALPAELVVPPNTERLEFQFTSLNLAAPERALFRYRLEGHENTWSPPRTARTATFSKLPPGRFRFHVQAANEDGVWNETGCALTVRVLPPFWRTWWFLTASGLGLLGAIVGVVYFISTQRLQRELALLRQKEALERERSRIARDLHDQLGANLTRVSLLGELIEGDKDQPKEVEAHARQISKTAGETQHALDEIVWAANPANDTLEGLVTYTCKYAQEFLTTAGLRCRLDVPAALPATPIAPDFRHNLFLVAKEAVNNVVKHAQAGSVRVQIKLELRQLVIEVEDDGRGPDGASTAAKRGRNGLRNMSRRMEDVGGSFSISPALNKGTLVRLTAPLTR
jgi:ligand-binding sensor domain-containing protein/signal transduction histidine kinase